MRKLKHLPLEDWPAADHEALRIAYEPGDIFNDNRLAERQAQPLHHDPRHCVGGAAGRE